MNLQDRIMEWLLAAFGHLMNTITSNWWKQTQGEMTWKSEIKIKEK